jgi:hypothetical protein
MKNDCDGFTEPYWNYVFNPSGKTSHKKREQSDESKIPPHFDSKGNNVDHLTIGIVDPKSSTHVHEKSLLNEGKQIDKGKISTNSISISTAEVDTTITKCLICERCVKFCKLKEHILTTICWLVLGLSFMLEKSKNR